MTLYEVIWDNGEVYGDKITNSHIFTTLEKAKEYYNKEHKASGYSYSNETLTLCSFEPDIDDQKRTKIESKVLLNSTFWTQDAEEDEWECNLDEFNACDIEDTY